MLSLFLHSVETKRRTDHTPPELSPAFFRFLPKDSAEEAKKKAIRGPEMLFSPEPEDRQFFATQMLRED